MKCFAFAVNNTDVERRHQAAIWHGGEALAARHLLRAGDPVGEGEGAGFAHDALLAPLAAALPGYEVRTDLAVDGDFEAKRWRATSGHLLGLWRAPLWGLRPTDRLAFLRFGCFERVEAGAVVETLLLLDLPSLMRQSGCWPLAEPPGPDPMAPAPLGYGGDAAESLARVEAMIAGLMRYDGRDLASMGMRDHWTPEFDWFGPAAIGSFRGHADYERGHQRPFLRAFPDRVGGNHRARVAQGSLVASTGWPSIRATHAGDGWLGLPATGRAVTMRVMDFWRVEGGVLHENWVMIDIPHLLAQLGVDLLGLARDKGETHG